jgi:hypothetical protein
MIGIEDISLKHVQFDESGHAIISHPETVARLRRALLRERVGSNDLRSNPVSETISHVRGMTFPSPILIRGTKPEAHDPNLATAVLRFGQRRIFSLGPVVDADTPDDIRSQIEGSDFAGQLCFGAKPYASAFKESKPVTRYVLKKLAAAGEELFGPGFDENQMIVAVAVWHKERYGQVQGAHIDWTKGAEFCEDEWQHQHTRRNATNTLGSIETRHSVECVLGGPPTEFFLDEQTTTIRLHRVDDGRWTISALEFSDLGTPQPGLSGEVLFRPGYTIHQFPLATNWTSASKVRLFVSCDYYWSRPSGGVSE